LDQREVEKLHNEELRNLYSSQSIIRKIKSRRMRWVGHVAQRGDEECIKDIGGIARRKETTSKTKNTSTLALRVVGGDEKGSLEPQTVKYGHEAHGIQTRE
jgi:hypothetical protein